MVDIASCTTLFTRLDEHIGVSIDKRHLPNYHYQKGTKAKGNVTLIKYSPSARCLATTGMDCSVKVSS